MLSGSSACKHFVLEFNIMRSITELIKLCSYVVSRYNRDRPSNVLVAHSRQVKDYCAREREREREREAGL